MSALDPAEGIFNDLEEEVNTYFVFLNTVINERPKLYFSDDNIQEIDSDITHILKATAFLLLYNLVEATLDRSFKAIHLELKDVGFDSLQSSLQIHIIKAFRKSTVGPSNIDTFFPISKAIHNLALEKSQLFSGNADARKIRALAASYNLTLEIESEARNGSNLLTVKNRRNEIGHGEKSFIEVGKDTPVEQLDAIKTETLLYMKNLLSSISSYLESEGYLKVGVEGVV